MPREAGLLQSLTATDHLGDLLPVLHQHAVSAVQGQGSILFEFDRTGEALWATSASGIDGLPPDPWPARHLPERLFHDGRPEFVAHLQGFVRGLGGYLGAGSAVLVPLAHIQDAIGVLVVGAAAQPSPMQLREVSEVGHAFVLALERTRLAGESDLQLQLRTLLQDFSRHASSTTLSAGLEALCVGANRLFRAERTSVWLHDRRAQVVVLSASSDLVYLAEERRIATANALAPAAAGLRRERSEVTAGAARRDWRTGTLTIPLKGKRRALGTMVMEGVWRESGSEMELLERADEIGRQLSGALENVLLLDTVLRSRRDLENTFNSLADLVAVCDQDGRLVYTNRAFLERSRKLSHEVINHPLAEAVGPATRALIERSRDRSDRHPRSAEIEDPSLRGTFLFTLTPLLGHEGESTGLVLVARDITAHAQLEAERAELRNRLVQSEKLVALGQLVAGIAHELNNPLQGVLGHLELLRATGAFPKDLRRDLQRIYREADRAAKIVRNLLVFAGSRRLLHKRTSINATLSRVLALRAPAFRLAKIEVVRRHEDALPRVKGDPLLLHQALLNIVLNAEEAIGSGGGRIETDTFVREQDGETQVEVRIRDTGPGIPPSAMPRLFEPFFTTKEVGKGTGLGLAITYGIIQEHGGQISAANHPEGGAVFTVQLPVKPG